MNIIQITPGAGGMFCGGCFRDNALVGAWRKQGHAVTMVPLYLPLTLEEADNSAGAPIFFGGINVYLEQKLPWFQWAPRWLHRLLSSPALLKLAAGSAAKTRAQDVGALTLSMARGEEGRQARELNELVAWLKAHENPDVICLSNALLLGLARRLKAMLSIPIVCLLTGEDSFLDALPGEHRGATWATLAERAREVDLFVGPTRYYGDLMRERLGVPPERVRVIYNGINLEGYQPAASAPEPPVLGYFARMCREKGLELLAEAFVILKQRDRVKGLKLRVGGGMGPSDEPLVRSIRRRFETLGYSASVEFCPNLERAAKQDFYRSLSVFSVPAHYGEAFGLYLVEAWASGVPVVQPRHAGFPELVEATGGGLLCDPHDPVALANAIERLLLDPQEARTLGEAGRRGALEKFSIDEMAKNTAAAFRELQKKLVPAH